MQPWPCAFTRIKGKSVKIYGACVTDAPEGTEPGQITGVTKKSFAIVCGEGALQIKRLQPEERNLWMPQHSLRETSCVMEKGYRET